MGERDLGPSALRAHRRRWTSWLAPVALLAFLLVLEIARPATAPESGGGLAHYLQAESLALDGDFMFAAEDLQRLRQLPQAERLTLELARRSDGQAVYPGAGPEALWLAPFAAIGGPSGAVFGTALAVVWAMGLAASSMRSRLHTPWGLLLLALFASVAVRLVFEPRAEALVLAAVVAAFTLAYRVEASAFAEMPEVYDQAMRLGGWRLAARWMVIGGLLAVAGLYHPLYLALLVPAALAVPTRIRRAGTAWLLVGCIAVVTLSLAVSGGLVSPPWLRPVSVFSPATGFPGLGAEWSAGRDVGSLLGTMAPQLHVEMLGWNGLFLVLGQSVGALPYFLPLLLFLALWEPRSGRSPLVVTVSGIAVASIVLWPFDWAGAPGAVGNALLLPAFGALWLLPTRPAKGSWLLLITVFGGLFLWPMWLEVVGLRSERAPAAAVSPVAVRWLPVESTLRVGEESVTRHGAVAVRVVGGAVSERGGSPALEGGRWGELLLISRRPRTSVVLEFDGQAGSELEVAGGKLGNTVFRGDGGIAFEILFDGSDRRHPMWWSAEEHTLYDLRLRLPKAPPYPVAFRVELLDDTGL